ncbi:pirin family protein [Musicola paradisiaca]|uniref:Pirin domain protein n=1 Tax=Musicola paradisiaca (strain Ech703) TaxID=579405 RepID=C6C3W9_MUSP7|nr:pirin family protein [Musicola paradisiaca]ACS87296.1 Pirin domain protein [Musicola paradisiaca Ech703]
MRTVATCHAAYRDDIADLITRRPVPGPGVSQVDPFLFLNHHGPQVYAPNNQGLPFGPHPHRGFETVTFILEGSLAHRDSGGHESIINAGGVQWMTAGSGLVHSELSPDDFKRHGGAMEILQLWVNLPARLKMTPPRYIGLQRDAIPCVPLASGMGDMQLISGEYQGAIGPIPSLTGVFMSVVQLQPGAETVLPAPQGCNVFLYVVRGAVIVADTAVVQWNLVEMRDDGDAIAISATDEAVLLFGYAEPIEEPVVSYGPFVMNSREEIQQAIADYHAGKFDKV